MDGVDFGPFLWKAVLFGVCWYLNTAKPLRYAWSVLFLFGLLPALLFAPTEQDPLGLLVRLYLSWMCAEVSFQSAAAEPRDSHRP